MSDADIHIDKEAPAWSPAMVAKAVVMKGSLIDTDGEVKTLTIKDIKSFRPAKEVLPASVRRKIGIPSQEP